MRTWGFLIAIFLIGCAQRGTVVESENGVDFGRYRRIGVLTFVDRHGQGEKITAGIEAGLRKLHFDIADSKTLDKILLKNRPDAFYGLNLEALSEIRTKASTDALLFGSVAYNWHQATISFVDTELGDTVFHATLKPRNGKKTFESPDEVVSETLRIFETEPEPSN